MSLSQHLCHSTSSLTRNNIYRDTTRSNTGTLASELETELKTREGQHVADAHGVRLKLAELQQALIDRGESVDRLAGALQTTEANARELQARLEEIFDFVHWEIKRSGFDNKLIGGIVLTGGGALLKNIELLASYQTGLEARLGLPTEHLAAGYRDEISSPIFATGIGLLIHGIENMQVKPKRILDELPAGEDTHDDEPEAKGGSSTVKGYGSGWLEKVFDTTRGLFEAHPDKEL